MRWSLLIAIAATACLGMAGLAQGGGIASTFVKQLSWTDADGETDYFDGHVSSSATACVKNRTVSLRRKQGGRDPRIGRTGTEANGDFLIEREDPGSGRYYVRVRATEAGGVACEKARSGTLQIKDIEDV